MQSGDEIVSACWAAFGGSVPVEVAELISARRAVQAEWRLGVGDAGAAELVTWDELSLPKLRSKTPHAEAARGGPSGMVGPSSLHGTVRARVVVQPLASGRTPTRMTGGQVRFATEFLTRVVAAERSTGDDVAPPPSDWAAAVAAAGHAAVDRTHLGVFPDPDDEFEPWAELVGDRKLLDPFDVAAGQSCLWVGHSGRTRGLPVGPLLSRPEETGPADWAVQVGFRRGVSTWEAFGVVAARGMGEAPAPPASIPGDRSGLIV